MPVKLIAVGNRQPAWVNEAVNGYMKRCSRETGLQLVEVPAAKRSKTTTPVQNRDNEAERIRRLLSPGDIIVVLDEKGRPIDTAGLAEKLRYWRDGGHTVNIIIGGPDGLAADLSQVAHESWSVSAMTLPHGLVRVLITEQLYRAWSILAGHPYHREG